jgi:dipeptidyl-peptidase III
VHLECFQNYAALFFFNQGNYYGYGDKKFTPGVPVEFLESMANRASTRAVQLLESCKDAIMSAQPRNLGYPDRNTLSGYYAGSERINKEEIDEIDKLLDDNNIGLENTRIFKERVNGSIRFIVRQASTQKDKSKILGHTASGEVIELQKGDHAQILEKVCQSLKQASDYCENETQKSFLGAYIAYFTSGDIIHFKEAQERWIKDRSPIVEFIFGFVEVYRDPAGRRAEFEGIVALTDKAASETLHRLVECSQDLIAELPWVRYCEDGDSVGPFESDQFEPPDFTAIHGRPSVTFVVIIN